MLKLQFFEQICFFHQKWFFSNKECNFDNPTKNFSPKNHRFITQIPKKEQRSYEFFGRKIIFPQIVLLHMQNPFVTSPWKFCRQNSENFLLEIRKGWKTYALSKQNNFSPKCSSEHAQWNFGQPSVTLLPKKRKTFPNSKIVEVTIFWTNFFFHQKWFLATEISILTTVATSFLWESTHLQLRFRKPQKKTLNFSEGK